MNRRISLAEYQALVKGARVLQQEDHGVKVWLLPDGRVVKLFRTKRLLSSARVIPYSTRFARNARRLRRRGIRVPQVLDTFHCPAIRRHGVIYRLLPGEEFASVLQHHPDADTAAKLARFLADLHEKGIYFRSVHPGNVLLTEEGEPGLIDLQDVRFAPWPLSRNARARNFRHLFRSDVHSRSIRRFGCGPFVELYLQALPRSGAWKERLRRRLLARECGQKQSATRKST